MLTPFGSFLKTVSEVFLVFLLVFLDNFYRNNRGPFIFLRS